MENGSGVPQAGDGLDNLKLYTSEKAVLRALKVTTLDGFAEMDLDEAAGVVDISRPTLFRLKLVQRDLRRQRGMLSPLARKRFS